MCERFGLHFEIDLGVDVGGVHGDVAKPGTNRVDVHTATKQMEDQEKLQALKLAELKAAIQAGIVSGTGVPAEEVFDRLEKKYAAMGTDSSS